MGRFGMLLCEQEKAASPEREDGQTRHELITG